MGHIKHTPLYDQHVALAGKLVPFAGFEMPIEYTGIVSEHRAVRTSMGMFDLSHMGEATVTGRGSLEAIDNLVTNDIRALHVGQARYTPMCLADGGIIDDLLVYRYDSHLMLVINASNTEKDLEWITEHLPPGVSLANESDSIALIAIQGPKAVNFVQTLTAINVTDLVYYHFTTGEVAGVPATISRTGYTGEDGLELYVDASDAERLWGSLLSAGRSEGLVPVGLGARDTLRLEAGLALYGNDIDSATTPLEAGLGWTVKLNKDRFIGLEALRRQKSEGLKRRLVAIEMMDRSIPRPHYAITTGDLQVGELRSGTFSPTLSKGIGMGYVSTEYAKVGTELEVEIRGQKHPASVARKPFYQRPA